MKRNKKILLCITSIFTIFLLYSICIIIDASSNTAEILSKIEKSGKIKLKITALTKRQKKILLMVEDPAFYSHKGIDLSTPGAGLTTITQSLVKWLYFKNFKPGLAKIKQSLIALFVLDRKVAKEKQLELFINLCGLGRSPHGYVYGFANAAKIYYNKPFKKLSEGQFISLVAMLIAPRNFHLKNNPQANKTRTQRIKALINGSYTPNGLMDLYYGPLPQKQQTNLPPFSYFKNLYKK